MVTAQEWSLKEVRGLVRAPAAQDDKYSRGVVGIRTGSPQYPGAAMLGVEAAWRTGAGYVRFHGAEQVGQLVLLRRPETVVLASDSTDYGTTGAWVLGSGTDSRARSAAEEKVLHELLNGDVPVVADGGVLDLVPGAKGRIIMTPHLGELRRLRRNLELDSSMAPVKDSIFTPDERIEMAVHTARIMGRPLVLKGAQTLIVSSDQTVLSVSRTPSWLATAGTGDVLAGIAGAVVAANPSARLIHALATAVWIHAEAARLASGMVSGGQGQPIVAGDLAAHIPKVVAGILASQ